MQSAEGLAKRNCSKVHMMIRQLANFLVLGLVLVACGQAMVINIQEIKSEAALCPSTAERERKYCTDSDKILPCLLLKST